MTEPIAPVLRDSGRCLCCAGCVAVCAPAALRMKKLDWEIEAGRCNRCGACVIFCPARALEMA